MYPTKREGGRTVGSGRVAIIYYLLMEKKKIGWYYPIFDSWEAKKRL